MAHLIKSPDEATVAKCYRTALARADHWRQVDCYRLARMGEPRSRRLWRDFEREVPARARLVKADAETLAEGSSVACWTVDKVLNSVPVITAKDDKGPDGYCLACGSEMKKTHRRCKKCRAANRFYIGGVRPVKKKKARRAFTGKSYGAARPVSRKTALRAMLTADLASPDPALREVARKALETL